MSGTLNLKVCYLSIFLISINRAGGFGIILTDLELTRIAPAFEASFPYTTSSLTIVKYPTCLATPEFLQDAQYLGDIRISHMLALDQGGDDLLKVSISRA